MNPDCKFSTINNVLVVNAHPDDLEMMAGGTIANWVMEGKQIFSLTFTNGAWQDSNGINVRNGKSALIEEKTAAKYLGYFAENLNCEALKLNYKDELVAVVLNRIKTYKIDTILCPFDKDLHHDHEVVARVTIAASRRVPRLLMGQINKYIWHYFSPNIYVDISNSWKKKIESLKKYESEWQRAGDEWFSFLDSATKYYGQIIGVERAEAFYSPKYLI